ncbi:MULTISPECIES: acyl carrier protein [unclassified Cyanobium]|uniref:acyl carrier protein n=1 Tax=unclassified Cyanobium TaxID=2627006 RepID=UPI0020CF50E7|nr:MULTISPECIES: acyl carrier protein [unclassified Cyanobium]MCP9861475.1 acyl carrier protein [Cyanobium sp. Cruz-8H5]MCP9868689.1 acyl carrier protein [Cyanobium sp. Cruz-8D1]
MTSKEASGLSREQQILDFISSRLRRAGAVFADADLASLDIDSVGIDSLELTELIMELDDQFQVVIDDTVLTGSTTVAELASAVAQGAGGEHGG